MKALKSFQLIFALVCTFHLSGAAIGAVAPCGNHNVLGSPVNTGITLCKKAFVIGYSADKKIPVWVGYHLTKDSVLSRIERTDNFMPDDELDIEDSAKLKNYSRTGFDRGHIAPSAAIDIDTESMEESFELSNIAPQLPKLNRAGWKKVESIVRQWAVRYGEVFVFSGTHGELDVNNLPDDIMGSKAAIAGRIKDGGYGAALDGRVVIPAFFYKVVLIPSEGTSFGVWMPHQNISMKQAVEYFTSVDDVESRTNLDFFDQLPLEMQERIESKTIQF